MKLNELTIQDAGAGLRKKEFSVSDLAAACLDAIEKKDPEIHAYLEIFGDAAAAEAKKRDDELAAYSAAERMALPPLFGIPLAIKDNILIAGRRCTAGSRMLENYIAPYDATVIRKLKKQGAIFLGRTNMDEFAMGGSTEHSAYGPTKNPRDPARVPGGSSGGSAAAVAANMCLGALGSDTGGSIRQPAAFCGIVGMKPSYGAVSRHGLIAMASSLDVVGPLARSVADARIMFDAIAGGDAFDATAHENQESPKESKLPTGQVRIKKQEFKGLKVGVPREYFGAGLSAGVEKAVRDSLKKMEAAGAILEDIGLPHAPAALATYYIVVPSEVSANLARFDGIRYGHHAAGAATLSDAYTRSRAEGFGAEVKRRIMLGTYALSAGYYDAYYVKAQKARTLIRDDFDKAFEKVDVIAGPTAPTPAFAFGERSHDPMSMYLADIYTVAANLAGIPALSLPIPRGDVLGDGNGMPGQDFMGVGSLHSTSGNFGGGLPIGLQLVAPRHADARLFSIAQAIETLL